MPYVEEPELSPEQKLSMLIEKIIVVKGRISKDPTIWEFHFVGDKRVIRIDSEKVENLTMVRQQYLKTFDEPAPKLSPKKWTNFLSSFTVDDGTKEVIEAPEESENVFIARQVFELICTIPVSEDPDDAIDGRSLYDTNLDELDDKKRYYCMTSSKLLELVSNAGFKITSQNLSESMTELGLKKAGTPRVRYNGQEYKKRTRSWCFIPEIVDSHKKVD